MSNLPPAEVLAARLEHELTTVAIYAGAGITTPPLSQSIARAQEILAQLQEAMK